MVLGKILQAVTELFRRLFSLFGIMSPVNNITEGPNTLRVFIKYAGKTISTDLDPSWTIKQVKDAIAPKLQVSADEIKIIFAGNELPDSFILETSDVGQQSYLHAVRVRLQINEKETELIPGIEQKRISDSISANETSEELHQPRGYLHDQAENLAIQTSTRSFSITTNSDPSLINDRVAPGDTAELQEDKNNADEDPRPSTRSNFFVYCSTCDDLKEGKLRVRCAKCYSGAFTVSRHPQCWDDVLIQKQIEGVCEMENCSGQFAEFFFKCACHVTSGEDDSSSPLQQVKRNENFVPCLACAEAKDIALVFSCSSGHTACIDCFKQYAIMKINQRDFIQDADNGYTLGCPALCDTSFIKDPHHFKLMGKQQYERYQRFATEECLLQMGGIFCPQPNCGMGIIPEDVQCNKIACLHGCGYVFCKRCLEGWHIGACSAGGPTQDTSCTGSDSDPTSTNYNVHADRVAQAQWGDANRRAMRLSTKPCPNCRVPTERAGGCMHMECTRCKFEWCWTCQTKWNRECMGNHWFG